MQMKQKGSIFGLFTLPHATEDGAFEGLNCILRHIMWDSTHRTIKRPLHRVCDWPIGTRLAPRNLLFSTSLLLECHVAHPWNGRRAQRRRSKIRSAAPG